MTLKNPYKQGGMFEGASHLIFQSAKELRENMTAGETILWMYLKNKIGGLKFRRQHPIGVYIADFYCHKAKLIIEIDGSIHDLPGIRQKDDIRQKELEGWGYEVIRFSNEQVLTQIETVLETIEKAIAKKIFTKQQNTSS
jgi:cyclase